MKDFSIKSDRPHNAKFNQVHNALVELQELNDQQVLKDTSALSKDEIMDFLATHDAALIKVGKAFAEATKDINPGLGSDIDHKGADYVNGLLSFIIKNTYSKDDEAEEAE